jgi:hypothetical protein
MAATSFRATSTANKPSPPGPSSNFLTAAADQRRRVVATLPFLCGGRRHRLPLGHELRHPLEPEERRAIGAVELAEPVRRHLERRLEIGFERFDHRRVSRHAEHEAGLEPDAAHELHRAAAERDHGATHDVLGSDAVRHMIDHFRLGEDGADAAHRDGRGRAQGVGADILGLEAEIARRLFEEGAGARGAFAVEAERANAALAIDADRLDVSATTAWRRPACSTSRRSTISASPALRTRLDEVDPRRPRRAPRPGRIAAEFPGTGDVPSEIARDGSGRLPFQADDPEAARRSVNAPLE